MEMRLNCISLNMWGFCVKNKIVTICGSAKFWDKIQEISEKLELEQECVVIGMTPHVMERDFTTEEKGLLGELHKRKIDLSDAVYVVNVNGYIGESVSEEIAYARKKGKEIMYLEEKITLCGDNCLECPRYHAHTEEELKHAAELWYRVGWRDRIVSNEEIACTGCSKHKKCTYQLVECTQEHQVSKCAECDRFPCDKIRDMLKKSADY